MECTNGGGQARLITEVIAPGLCVGCGACVGLCPYHEYKDGRIVVLDRCHAETSRCYQVCPQSLGPLAPKAPMIDAEKSGTQLGPCLEIHMAQGVGEMPGARRQYGGVISCLLVHASRTGLIDASILTSPGGLGEAASGTLAATPEEILACAGSRYSAAGTLAALNRALRAGRERLAVVGLPCQMQALARMRLVLPDGEERSRAVALRLGLFCTWALDYRILAGFLTEWGVNGPIQRCDIPPPPAAVFQVETLEGMREFPLDDVRPAIQKGCGVCKDMTAEWADVSVGAAEGHPGWNTVLVRTEAGRELFQSALEAGLLRVEPLPEASLQHLKGAALNKRMRGEQAALERRGEQS